jgi:uncharacterized protein (TIGR03437 family)
LIATGDPAPSGSLVHTTAQPTTNQQECLRRGFVCAAVGSKIATVQFSGLAPGFVGLWQINVMIPTGDDVLTGDAVRVSFFLDQRQTNPVTISIR